MEDVRYLEEEDRDRLFRRLLPCCLGSDDEEDDFFIFSSGIYDLSLCMYVGKLIFQANDVRVAI